MLRHWSGVCHPVCHHPQAKGDTSAPRRTHAWRSPVCDRNTPWRTFYTFTACATVRQVTIPGLRTGRPVAAFPWRCSLNTGAAPVPVLILLICLLPLLFHFLCRRNQANHLHLSLRTSLSPAASINTLERRGPYPTVLCLARGFPALLLRLTCCCQPPLSLNP